MRYYMFYWPITSATLGILSNIFVGILLAVWLYFKFCSDSSDDTDTEESFEIEDIFASGVDGENESVSTMSRENHETEGEQGSRADGRAATTSSFPAHRQFIQARRSRSSAPTQDVTRRVRPISLTSRNARITRDSCCQTEPHSSIAAVAHESKAKVE